MEKKKVVEQKNIEHSYFYSLELEGVNCFKDKQTLDLSDGNGNYSPLTIILGDNGTGKTTLLKILDKVQPDDYIVDFSKQNIEVKGNYYFPKFYYGGIKDDSKFNIFESGVEILVKILSHSKINEISIGWKQESKNYFYSEFQKNVFILTYGASRRMSKSQNLRSSITKYSNTLFDDSIELINAEEWFLQKEWAVLKSDGKIKQRFQNQFDSVKKTLLEILPDVQDIVSKTIDENNSKPKIEVKTSFGWVTLRDLSFGYQTLTALIVDIAANMMEKYPESENPLKEPAIILIDEIDLHLHPKWQRTVIDKLSKHFPKAQFIATSHSPLIVQAALDKKANIVVCRKEGDKVVIDNNPDEVKGWRIDQILTSDLFELSSSKSIAFEEIRNEKTTILLKNELTDSDKERLDFINEKLNNTPVFSSKEAINAEELIKKAAELLKK
jgi:predicted ATP-binding protein involved in virulence